MTLGRYQFRILPDDAVAVAALVVAQAERRWHAAAAEEEVASENNDTGAPRRARPVTTAASEVRRVWRGSGGTVAPHPVAAASDLRVAHR